MSPSFLKRWGLPCALLAAFPAASRAACALDSGIVIYYGNGMFITPARAPGAARIVGQKIPPPRPPGGKVTFCKA